MSSFQGANNMDRHNKEAAAIDRRTFCAALGAGASSLALGAQAMAAHKTAGKSEPKAQKGKDRRKEKGKGEAGAAARGKGPLNIILIISDTIRQDYCGCYGNDWVRTPHIDALAAQSAVMDHYYSGSFPTGPVRKDLHSGRYTFAYGSWGDPRPEGEKVVAEMLHEQGYLTAYIGDTDNAPQYRQGFDHEDVISHVASKLDGVPETVELTAAPEKLRFPVEYAQSIARNALGWDGESDRRAARTMRAAHRWLEDQRNAEKPFFLWIDTFDPHEPWDPPRYYIDLYDKGYVGDELMEPAYSFAGYASEQEIRHMRCMYAAELTMVDRWLGYLLEGIQNMGLAGNTALLFASDHGFYHGEHGFIGKVQLDRENVIIGRWPLYSTIAHSPLIVHVPGGPAGKHYNALCQPADITATILDLAGAGPHPELQGRSLLPVVDGKTKGVRDAAVSTLTHVTDGQVRCPAAVRTHDVLYIYGGDEWKSELYDLATNPDESHNVFEKDKPKAKKMHQRYLEFLEEIRCPSMSLDARREFDPAPRSDLPYQRVI